MKHLSTEVHELVNKHREELEISSRLFGGVYIEFEDGMVIVCGADNLDMKVIFRTSFVADEYEASLDARVLVQDILESEGIDVVSRQDFEIALEGDEEIV
jgi:hypothetical protein